MKKPKFVPSFVSVFLSLLLLLSACSAAASPTNPPSEMTSVAAPGGQSTTPSPSATNTHAPSPTQTASPSPTITPTSTPSGLLPGLYQDANGCVDVTMGQRPITITWCVASIEVTEEGGLIFTVTWAVTITNTSWYIIKRNDRGNTKMFIKDEFGRTYDHISVGGDAAIDVYMRNGYTALGWYVFPPPKDDARSFTFYDNNNGVSIGPLLMINRTILLEKTPLTWHPLLLLRYRVADWTLQANGGGGLTLVHTRIPGCQIVELNTKEPQGRFKYEAVLGTITYKLYARYNDATDSSIREYLVAGGLEDMSDPPMFQAILPDAGVDECSVNVTEALEGLLPVKP